MGRFGVCAGLDAYVTLPPGLLVASGLASQRTGWWWVGMAFPRGSRQTGSLSAVAQAVRAAIPSSVGSACGPVRGVGRIFFP